MQSSSLFLMSSKPAQVTGLVSKPRVRRLPRSEKGLLTCLGIPTPGGRGEDFSQLPRITLVKNRGEVTGPRNEMAQTSTSISTFYSQTLAMLAKSVFAGQKAGH
jgi:hypothetical protein